MTSTDCYNSFDDADKAFSLTIENKVYKRAKAAIDAAKEAFA